MTNLRALAFTCISLVCTCAASAADLATRPDPTAEQYATVLNLAGRQRMLTQKMTKEFLLVAAEIETDASRKALGETVTLFENTLKGLKEGDSATGLPPTTNERTVKQIDTVKTMFDDLKPVFTRTAGGEKPSAADLTTVAEKNLTLLEEMNKVVKMYERSAKDTLGDGVASAVVINLAGKQRMLSQKMSKEFLFVYLGVKADENRLNIRETASLFDRTLKGLQDGDSDLGLPGTKDAEARKLLDSGVAIWKDFHPVINKATDASTKIAKADAEAVAKGNMPLLKAMNESVVFFEKHAKTSGVANAEAK